jgi:hypothetical protein
MQTMTIADTRMHIWGANTPECPWPSNAHSQAHRAITLVIAAPVAEMDAAGVIGKGPGAWLGWPA